MPAASGAQAHWRIEALGKQHDRAAFTSGSEPLDKYLKTQASQDIRRRVAKCLVAVDAVTGAVDGYYTLSATSLALAELPDALAKTLPRYPVVPAVLLGRLAVAAGVQGRQLGRAMLAHAIEYVATSNIGAYAIVVDAKDGRAQQFYERFGFVLIAGQARRLILLAAARIRAYSVAAMRERYKFAGV